MKFRASYTVGGDSSSNTYELGVYDDLSEAIDACCKVARDDDEDFDFEDEEEDICRDALETRGFYCVGYSTLSLCIDEV